MLRYVSRRALEIPGMPNADLCGKASPTCMATVGLHLTLGIMSIVVRVAVVTYVYLAILFPLAFSQVLLTGTPLCKYCVQVFGASKKDKSE